MKNKILFLLILMLNISLFSQDFELRDLRKNKVEIKEDKYVMLTFGQMACKDCYGLLIEAIHEIDSTLKVYCIMEDQKDLATRKSIYGIAKYYSGLNPLFYIGADHLIFRYPPNVLIVENGFQTYIRHQQLFRKNYTLESLIDTLSRYIKNE